MKLSDLKVGSVCRVIAANVPFKVSELTQTVVLVRKPGDLRLKDPEDNLEYDLSAKELAEGWRVLEVSKVERALYETK